MTSFRIQFFPGYLNRLCLVFFILIFQVFISSELNGQLNPDFEADEREVCSGSSVIFTDKSETVGGNISYEWDFGAGASPRTAAGPGPHNVTYNGSGRSTVSLTIERGFSVSETKENYINVLPSPPSPSYTIDCEDKDEEDEDDRELTLLITYPLGDDYEYSLDGDDYDDDNEFDDIEEGNYTLYVRNKDDCISSTQITISCGCVNPSSINLARSEGSICGTGAFILDGNTFSGEADGVTLSHNGAGTVSHSYSSNSSFSFSYNSSADDVGSKVEITITSEVPDGSSCDPASETFVLSVSPIPDQPSLDEIIQPDCNTATGSIELNNLPDDGQWTINPGGFTATSSSYTISGLQPGNYAYTVTNETGCTSPSSSTITINSQPSFPDVPVHSVECEEGENYANVEILSPLGPGLEYSLDQGNFQAEAKFWTVTQGDHEIRVRNTAGCITSGDVFTVMCDCENPSTLSLSVSNENSCGLEPVTVSNNRFGGGASEVTITSNGDGELSYSSLDSSPFDFTYTPSENDFDKTIEITVTTNNISGPSCSPVSSTYTLNVHSRPSPPRIDDITQPDCDTPTGSLVLNNLPVDGEWTINPGNISGNSYSYYLDGLDPGNYNFTVTSSDYCTSSPSQKVVIGDQPQNPSPPEIRSINQPSCEISTGNIVLEGLPPDGRWVLMRIPGDVITTGEGTTTTLTELSPGNYYYVVRNASGCSSGYSEAVRINSPPDSPSSPQQIVDCSIGVDKAVIEVISPVGSGLEYSLDQGSFQEETNFLGVNNGNHTISVRNASGCITTGETFSVSCGCPDPPTLKLTDISGSSCELIPITISGNRFGGSATGVTVSSDGEGELTNSSLDSSPFEFTYTPAEGEGGSVVRIQVTTNNPNGAPCSSAIQVFTLTINPNPRVPSMELITYPDCDVPYGIIEFTGLPEVGLWTLTVNSGEISFNGTGNSAIIDSLSPGFYSFTMIDQNECESPTASTIEIPPPPDNPSPPIIDSIIPPGCNQSTGGVMFSGLPEEGSWLLVPADEGLVLEGSGSTAMLEGLVEGTYNYSVETEDGCISDYSGDIVIPAQPETPSAPVVGEIIHPDCDNPTGSVELTGMPVPGSWRLTRFPGRISNTGTGSQTIVAGLSPGTYNFMVTNADGCISQVSENLIISASSEIPLLPVINQVIQPTCYNPSGSIHLTGLPEGVWQLLLLPDTIIIEGSGTNYTISNLEPGIYKFMLVNEKGCESEVSSEIQIYANISSPEIIVTNPDTVCEPDRIDLTSSYITRGSTEGLFYTYWYDEETTREIESPDSVGTGTYYIMGMNQEGCYDIAPVTAAIIDLPHANAGPDRDLDYIYDTYLEAQPVSVGETGVWSVIEGQGIIEDSTDADSRVYNLSSGENTFLWMVDNHLCPLSYDSVTLRVNELVVPTLITPNMDGKNDYLVFMDLEYLGRSELMIFDRYGNNLYEDSDYKNNWNGIDNNGNPLPDDTYFYILKSEGLNIRTGYIVVRRGEKAF